MASETASEDVEQLNAAEKIALHLLGANNQNSVPGNIWLQKEFFLLSRHIDDLQPYLGFEPHFQGPFSETVNNIKDNLEYLGFVERTRAGLQLTERGEQVEETIRKGSSEEILDLVEEIKDLLNDLSKDELLVYIYYSYPDMTSESLEKDDLEPKRKSVAKKLYQRGKVDQKKAAELSGHSVSEFEEAT